MCVPCSHSLFPIPSTLQAPSGRLGDAWMSKWGVACTQGRAGVCPSVDGWSKTSFRFESLWYMYNYGLNVHINCAPENSSHQWAPSPYHHSEYYLCPFGRVCSLLRRDPLPRALQAAANMQTYAPLGGQRGGPLLFSKTWLNSAKLHQGELCLALVSRGNHEGVINCCKKALVETHPRLFLFLFSYL